MMPSSPSPSFAPTFVFVDQHVSSSTSAESRTIGILLAMVLTLCILVLLSSPLYFVAKEAQEEVMDSAVAEEAPQQDEMVESGQLPLVSAPEGISLQERKVCLSNLLIAAKYNVTALAHEHGALSCCACIACDVSGDSTRAARIHVVEDGEEVCAICLDQFVDGDDICMSQDEHCPHFFHVPCALEWLLKSQLCPCCRRNYLAPNGTAPGANS